MPRPPVMACINAERGGQLGETIANGCHPPAVRNGEFLNKEGAMLQTVLNLNMERRLIRKLKKIGCQLEEFRKDILRIGKIGS